MSNRTLVELNHDYCPRDIDLLEWAKALQGYMRSGDPVYLPKGVVLKGFRHHSDPEFEIGDSAKHAAQHDKLLETVRWIASQQNLFFAECSQAEEIIARCKEALGEAEHAPQPEQQTVNAEDVKFSPLVFSCRHGQFRNPCGICQGIGHNSGNPVVALQEHAPRSQEEPLERAARRIAPLTISSYSSMADYDVKMTTMTGRITDILRAELREDENSSSTKEN